MKFFLKFSIVLVILWPSAVVAQQRISLEQYIETWAPVAIEEMHRFGIPASIKLAQGILESGFGNSDLAVKANNHFGIKCHGWQGKYYLKDDDERNECFRAYPDAAESFSDHSLFLTTRPRYARLFELEITDYRGWAHGLRAAGYATNPQYPQLLIGIIERNELDRFDRMEPLLAEASAAGVVSASSRPASRQVAAPAARREARPSSRSREEIFPVPLEGPRQELTNNRIRYVRARPGDTPASVARELGMREWQIRNYNELQDRKIEPGQILYLQPKRRRGALSEHLVQTGQSMYDISQQYGIKLKHLYRRNNMEPGQHPWPGQVLLLR